MNGRELRDYKDGSTIVIYKYNLDGIRTEKKVGSTTIKYYLNGMNIAFEDREEYVLYYIYNKDEVLGFVYNGVTYYYHKNILGDVIGILDSNYQEIVTYSYDAYGNILSTTDNSTNNIGEINPFRYRSYYYDVETNLYYLNSRYYNPETGRFLNADDNIVTNYSLLGNNLFVYCGNNPIKNTDIKGKSWFNNVFKGAKKALNKAKNTAKNVYNGAKKTVTNTYTNVKKGAQNLYNGGKKVFNYLSNNFKERFSFSVNVGVGIGSSKSAEISQSFPLKPKDYSESYTKFNASVNGTGVSFTHYDHTLINNPMDIIETIFCERSTKEISGLNVQSWGPFTISEEGIVTLSVSAYFIGGGEISISWDFSEK